MSDEVKTPADTLDSVLDRLSKIQPITPEQIRQREESIRKHDESVRIARAAELMLASKAPKRQQERAEIDRSGPWGDTESKVAAKLGSGFLIALIGIRGCGKSQLGVELIRRNAQDFKASRFCSAMEFFMEIKAGYKEDGEAEKVVLREFERPSLLVIDELGQRSENEWENRLLYELINRRYNNVTDTLLISNQDSSQLESAIGPSLVSRMRETGGVIECDWSSYRR